MARARATPSTLAVATLATVLVASSARSDEADPVIADVAGTPLRASDVSRRLAGIPDFQRRTMGKTALEVQKRLVDDVIVPEMRLSATADAERLAERPGVRARLKGALRRMLVESLRDEVQKEVIPDGEISAYHDAHRREFEQPERIRISRILVTDEALAKRIIAESRGDGGLLRWKQFARDHSVDAATKMRGATLGFVAADGTTDVPQLQVDPVLFTAAAQVKDGELVPEPVREGERYAAVWRRGTSPKFVVSEAEATARIVYVLREARLEKKIAEILTRQRAAEVEDENPVLLEALPPEPPPPPPPPKGSGTPQATDPAPKPTERGLR